MDYSIILDNREGKLIDYFKDKPRILIEQLELGDIIFRINDNDNTEVKYIIERKSVSDLYSSIKDGRYREQKARLLANYPLSKIIYLIEGSIPYKNDSTYFGSVVNMLLRDNIKVFQCANINQSIMFIETIQKRFEANAEFLNETSGSGLNGGSSTEYLNTIKTKKKDNMTPENYQIIVLAQIPGMSVAKAKAILEKYNTLENVIYNIKTYSHENIAEIKINNRKIGNKVSERILKYLVL